MPKMRYYRHMSTDQDHPDDQTDDPDILKENLRHVRRRLADKERDLQAADAIVAEMREEVEQQGELREHWIEVFDMQMNEDGNWLFDREQTELWAKHEELLDEFDKLVRAWNRFVAEYNAVVAERAGARPGPATCRLRDAGSRGAAAQKRRRLLRRYRRSDRAVAEDCADHRHGASEG